MTSSLKIARECPQLKGIIYLVDIAFVIVNSDATDWYYYKYFVYSDSPQGQEPALEMDDMRKAVNDLRVMVESLKTEREQDRATIRNLEESNRSLREANIQLQATVRELNLNRNHDKDCCPLLRCVKFLMGKDSS